MPIRIYEVARRGKWCFDPLEHNLDGLLRGDSASRAAFMKAMGEAGLRTINEMRRTDNLPPLPGGDVAMRQSQYVPITDLGTNKEPRNNGA